MGRRNPGFTSILAFLFAALWSASARAQGVREVFVFVDPTIKCIQYDALMTSLRRDTPYEVHATGRGAPPRNGAGDRRVRLELASDENGITVSLEGDGLHVAERLQAPRCDAATEVVAAFVTSALTPPPAVPITPEREVRWAPEPKPVSPGPAPSDTMVAQRATLLADALAANVGHQPSSDLIRALGVVAAVSGVTLAAVGAAFLGGGDDKGRAAAVGFIGGGALFAIGGINLALHPDDSPPSYFVAPALLSTGVLAGSAFRSFGEAPPFGVGGIVGGYAGQAGLLLLSDLIRPPLTLKRMRGMRASIRTPEQRATLSREGLRALEREVADAKAPWPPFVAVLPLVIGGGVALASTLDDDYKVETRIYVTAEAVLMLGMAISWAQRLSEAPDRLYAKQLERTGFEFGVLPVPGGSGISVSGRF